jgi:hypothetical protein
VSELWKFPLLPSAKVLMPEGARVLSVGQQDGQPYLWALVDPSARIEMRDVLVIGTGHVVPSDVGDRPFVGSIHGVDGWIVLHVFDAVRVVVDQRRAEQ